RLRGDRQQQLHARQDAEVVLLIAGAQGVAHCGFSLGGRCPFGHGHPLTRFPCGRFSRTTYTSAPRSYCPAPTPTPVMLSSWPDGGPTAVIDVHNVTETWLSCPLSSMSPPH